ncbi:hypothetical protein SARC_09556 [Sphaeroforma arctica JP610]|uniref:Uncharacterized protein n=1 Tax=Sphaeroforma arctica JP610 TaxID=667725 RepID=A0A0L0FMM1_9EUKA|nr:hypothetical protein SARC_09556 [Sphaeroforma arctica JP610]KNC78002.1 hypothetical protein SARC_09556 [Sphaeroforma arctica JP610]|eukprot:XP_014151904.1 hypothetical protein SARC_09556 [Sphaeroforma arctica JP610]
MNEYKQTWAARQAQMTAQLRDSEHAAKHAEDKVKAMELEVAEAHEQLEDSLLDKEMAEENLEISQSEATSVREELEALKLDFEIMQMEAHTPANAGDGEGGASALQVKLYTAEIDKYKAALVQLKDMSDTEKNQLTNQITTLEKKVTSLSALESKCGELAQTILEQVGDKLCVAEWCAWVFM